MSVWNEVRRMAQQRHAELASFPNTLVPATELLDAAERASGVKRLSRPAGDVLLDGAEAAYDQERKCIYYSRATEHRLANFYVAHEYAHHWLGEVAARCEIVDLDVSAPAEPAMSLVGDADAYSPKERSEMQANVFAREFLLPRSKLRRRCAYGQFDAAAIASEVAVPLDLVMQQLADALLLPEGRTAEPIARVEEPPDESQREAILATPGSRQVRAGPGSGKTRTLVGRVAHLVSIGEDPASILALTYSNLSAQDLASRIRAAIGDKAISLWAGTFHAYGLELLRKYGAAIGLPEVKLLDRTDCLMLLEGLLPDLDLNYYLNLYDPALTLRSILAAIGRAKDELASPADYDRCARAMRDSARDEEAEETAERAIEIARAYAVYDQTLRTRGLVDFGDLVTRPIELLRANPQIRDTIRAEKPHILVDEYQDMNRASGMLLRELVLPDRGPWVVGDVRQAIYRFRGASPLNMSRFGQDFPGAQTTDLSVNYRSGGKILRTFEAFGRRMTAAALASQGSLTASRGEHTGTVRYEIATKRESEAYGIAQSIQARVTAGARYGDHAVLARSHTILARLSHQLERAGVPCLYFGNFFERPEIRDLLALLSVVAELRGVGLLRVAQLPRYAVPPVDIAVLFAWRHVQQVSMLAALRKVDDIEGLSQAGRNALKRLADDVSFVNWPMSPHCCLMCYLFGQSEHIRQLMADSSVAGQQQRLAVYQLLQFAFSFKPPGTCDPKRALLDHIRRLEILDEDKQLRQLPAAATDIEAVKLMTVHASKGLEFPVVYVASLAKGLFPTRSRYEPCPPPAGMISTDGLMTPEAEEESLFFVAMSRARDMLHLSRALTNGKVTTNPSHFLEHIAPHLSKRVNGTPGWISAGPADPPCPALVGDPIEKEWTAHAFETYLQCPRKYYYTYVLAIGGNEDSSPYLRFQSALHSSIAWMRGVSSPDERRAGIKARFEADWSNFGPGGHAFESIYRSMAVKMINNAMNLMEGERLDIERTVTLAGTGVVVRCKIDHLQSTTKGVNVFRLKTSRLAKKYEEEKIRYVLWQEAIVRDYPRSSVTFAHVSLLTGQRRDSKPDRKKLEKKLEELDDVVRNVAAGQFDPNSNPDCPTCPYYFVCPSHGGER